MFIHEREKWIDFRWNVEEVNELSMQAMHALGYLGGRMAAIGFDSQLAASVESVTNDVIASWEIEGLKLDTEQVRSSVARRLGVFSLESKSPTHYVEGIVEMMLDATQNHHKPLEQERLFGWHAALFPHPVSGMHVAQYRTDEMTVVSGTFGRERIHYRGPAPEYVGDEMRQFLDWLNSPTNKPSAIKSAIAHLWFVSIHPFDDDNGRIARAISDMILAAFDHEHMRYYSLSRQILKDKSRYYAVLERTQRGNGDITEWLCWYLRAMIAAVDDSSAMLSQVLRKSTFWATHAQTLFSERQRTVLNHYLDGYDAKLTAKNWAKLAEVSKDTALRDITDLVKKHVLTPTPGRVRDVAYSINYTLTPDDSTPFSDIKTIAEHGRQYICATCKAETIKDLISQADAKRLTDGEFTLAQLALKHFAYLLGE